MDQTKRELRELKRVIKRAGHKHRRREAKRLLVENPEEAPYARDTFGRFETAGLNGIDAHTLRQRDRPAPGHPG